MSDNELRVLSSLSEDIYVYYHAKKRVMKSTVRVDLMCPGLQLFCADARRRSQTAHKHVLICLLGFY